MRKQLVVAGIATAVGVTGLTGVGIASATTTANGQGPMYGMVDAIATKFSLNKDEVQKVFDEQHGKMQAERTAEVNARIDQLVTDGKLTQEQADKLKAKHVEMQKEREAERASGEAKTREERRAEMQQHRAELEAWAEENGIDTEYLRLAMGGGRVGNGFGGPRH